MFERFTDRARRVVVLAQEEARMPGPGAQAIMVLLIWTAIVIINIAHARRR